MRVIGLSVALILAAGLVSTAQQPPQPRPAPSQGPTFRIEVSYVEIDAVVTDADGKFVRGLTKDDFEVLEDGKPQSISAFSVIDLPVRRATPPTFRATPVEPDVRSNEGDFNGRVIVLVLDDLLVDAKRTQAVRASAKQFINRFVSENDLVAVLNTGGSSGGSQNFTNQRELLIAAVNKFAGSRLTSVARTRMEDLQNGGTGVDRDALQRSTRSRTALGRLKGAADYLAGVRGRRKALVWFTEGVDFNLDDPQDPNGPAVRDALTELIGTAQRAGVSFYGVDPRGIGAGLEENIDINLPERDFTTDIGMQAVMNEVRWTQGSMRTISNETGGFVIIGGDINEQFGKVIDENSSYYLLGYYPSSDRKDGKFRSLDLRVKRPGLRVRYRKGYTAPRAGTPNRATAAAADKAPVELRAAIESPIPIAGVPMRVFAAPFVGPSKKGSVAIIIEFAPEAFRFQQQGDVFIENLDVLIVPLNAAGKALDGAHDQVPMKLSARSHELVRTHGFRILRRLDLPAGRYQLHVGAQSTNSKAVGALTFDLEVPEFTKRLSISGLVLMSTGADRIPTARPDKDFTDVLPMAATALRDFERSDTLFLFGEIYPQRAGTPHAVQIETTVTSDDGKVVFRHTDERRTGEMKGDEAGFGHSLKLPLANVVPGRYVVRVSATPSINAGAAVSREVEFRVR